jgi:hypothetical protein
MASSAQTTRKKKRDARLQSGLVERELQGCAGLAIFHGSLVHLPELLAVFVAILVAKHAKLGLLVQFPQVLVVFLVIQVADYTVHLILTKLIF